MIRDFLDLITFINNNINLLGIFSYHVENYDGSEDYVDNVGLIDNPFCTSIYIIEELLSPVVTRPTPLAPKDLWSIEDKTISIITLDAHHESHTMLVCVDRSTVYLINLYSEGHSSMMIHSLKQFIYLAKSIMLTRDHNMYRKLFFRLTGFVSYYDYGDELVNDAKITTWRIDDPSESLNLMLNRLEEIVHPVLRGINDKGMLNRYDLLVEKISMLLEK